MRRLGTLLCCWLLTGGIALADGAYPVYSGSLMDQADVLSRGQRAGLTTDLATLHDTTQWEGTVLISPPLDTWFLEPYADRLLAEWQAQGVVGAEAWVLVLVPGQHRAALSFSEPLARKLDAWTKTALLRKCATRCEEGALYLGARSVVEDLGHDAAAIKAAPPKSHGMMASWAWIFVGMLVLTATLLRRLRKKPQ
ncbi:MAG: TPM domain-containing protein [bacterium]